MSTLSPSHSSTSEIKASCRIVGLSNKWRPVVPENGVFGNNRIEVPENPTLEELRRCRGVGGRVLLYYCCA